MLFFVPFVLCSALLASAANFSFTSSTPSQCDSLTINWTGGSGSGYYLSIIPVFGVPRNISIPDSAFTSSNGSGSFSTVVQQNASDRIVLTMSDSTGFGAGGASQLFQVGQSLGGSCNLTAAVDFFYSLDPSPTQCQTSSFHDFSGGVSPVTIMGIIPGGDTFVLNPAANAKTFDWTANIFNGTQVIFLMIDSKQRQGGSELFSVGLSGDTSCINKDSPSSTTASSSATSSPSSSVLATPHSSSTGAIAGSVLGALIFLAVLITLGLFFLRQWQEKKKGGMAGGSEFRRKSRPINPELDLNGDDQQAAHLYNSPLASTGSPYQSPPAHYQPHSQYLAVRPESENPFMSSTTSLAASGGPSQHESSNTGVDPFMEQTTSEGASTRRKSGMSSYGYKQSRYVMHVDAEDEPPANEDGVVELPPQYSATRPPARGLPGSGPSNTSPPL